MLLVAAATGSVIGWSPILTFAVGASGFALARLSPRRLPLGLLLAALAAGWIATSLALGREQGILDANLPRSFESLSLIAVTDDRSSPFGRAWFVARPLSLDVGHGDEPWRGPNLLVRHDPDMRVTWSETWRIEGTIEENPGQAGGHLYAGVVQARAIEVLADPGDPLRSAGNSIRRRILDQLNQRRPAEALLAGLLVGDTTGLPAPDREALKRAGISHFVAVSGSNVAAFLLLWWIVLGPLGIGPRRRGWLGLLGLAIFIIVTRWEPSVVRAGLMAGVVLAGRAFGHSIDAWTSLGIGASLSILAAPNLVSDLGFQLSLLATTGIMLGHDLLPQSLPSWLRKPLGATLAAQLAVAPLLLGQNGEVPLVAPLANLAAAPLVAGSTLLGSLGILFQFGPLQKIAVFFSTLILGVARQSAWLPQVGAAVLAATAVAVVAALQWRGLRLLVGFLGAAALVLMLFGGRIAGPSAVFLDIGQGDAALMVAGDGSVVLIDGGPDPELLWRAIYHYRIKRIRLLVATHPHDDHVAGLVGIAGRLPIGEVWYTGDHHPSTTWDGLVDELSMAGVPLVVPRSGARVRLDDLILEVRGPERRYDGPNDQSLVIVVSSSVRSVLMSGDAEVAAQEDLGPIDVDVLKVPHHGGNTSLPRWIRATTPDLAVISVGPNRFGHPAPELLSVLETTGARVVRTDEVGDVVVPLS